jgi:2-polyprenyl-3-methyl-5-hydroxy-6-metoxy-1,4-benzoquinol methylase
VHQAGYFEREYFELHSGKVRYLEWLVHLLGEHGVERGRVLDVGSGYGFLLEALERAGYEPYGLEVAPEAAEVSRGRTRAPVATGSA